MAGGAVIIIGFWRDAEVVDDIFFAEPLLVLGIEEFPGPVLGLVDLFCRFGMAFDAGLRYVGARCKVFLQLLEFGVIGRRCGICGACKQSEQ